MGTISKQILAINDIQSAKNRGVPLYEVVARNQQTTLEFSPHRHDIKKCVDDSIGCIVYQHLPNGTKFCVVRKQSGKIIFNQMNLQE